MNFPSFAIAFVLILWMQNGDAFDPCVGRSGIGGQCDYNRDCGGAGMICKNGRCDCHYNYQLRNDSDGTKYCVKLPDSIGDQCQTQCRFPMFCNNGRCECVRATKEGKSCYPSAKLGDSCSQDAECTLPFSACIGGRCSCVNGANANNGQCVAAPHCPNGAKAGGPCIRLTVDRASIENRLNKDKDIDTCPSDQFCYGAEQSVSGVCCLITCPYSTLPNTAFSCAPNASNACPLDSHYCHRLAGQSFSISACCRRPCKEPTPLFVNGKCYPRAWLGGPCTVNEQCDAGETMQCNSGTCTCKSGFSPQSGSFFTSENPPQTCVRSCSGSPSRGGECFSSASLNGQCDVDDQCPSNGKCFRGSCICDCDKGYTRSGSSCIKLQTTTQAGRPVTNKGAGGLIDLIGGLGKGGSGSSGGLGGLGQVLGG